MRPRFGITADLGRGFTTVPEQWWWLRRRAARAAQRATVQCGGRHVWRVTTR